MRGGAGRGEGEQGPGATPSFKAASSATIPHHTFSSTTRHTPFFYSAHSVTLQLSILLLILILLVAPHPSSAPLISLFPLQFRAGSCRTFSSQNSTLCLFTSVPHEPLDASSPCSGKGRLQLSVAFGHHLTNDYDNNNNALQLHVPKNATVLRATRSRAARMTSLRAPIRHRQKTRFQPQQNRSGPWQHKLVRRDREETTQNAPNHINCTNQIIAFLVNGLCIIWKLLHVVSRPTATGLCIIWKLLHTASIPIAVFVRHTSPQANKKPYHRSKKRNHNTIAHLRHAKYLETHFKHVQQQHHRNMTSFLQTFRMAMLSITIYVGIYIVQPVEHTQQAHAHSCMLLPILVCLGYPSCCLYNSVGGLWRTWWNQRQTTHSLQSLGRFIASKRPTPPTSSAERPPRPTHGRRGVRTSISWVRYCLLFILLWPTSVNAHSIDTYVNSESIVAIVCVLGMVLLCVSSWPRRGQRAQHKPHQSFIHSALDRQTRVWHTHTIPTTHQYIQYISSVTSIPADVIQLVQMGTRAFSAREHDVRWTIRGLKGGAPPRKRVKRFVHKAIKGIPHQFQGDLGQYVKKDRGTTPLIVATFNVRNNLKAHVGPILRYITPDSPSRTKKHTLYRNGGIHILAVQEHGLSPQDNSISPHWLRPEDWSTPHSGTGQNARPQRKYRRQVWIGNKFTGFIVQDDVFKHITTINKTIDERVLLIRIRIEKRRLTFINMYGYADPMNRQDQTHALYDKIQHHVEKARESGDIVMVMGDTNTTLYKDIDCNIYREDSNKPPFHRTAKLHRHLLDKLHLIDTYRLKHTGPAYTHQQGHRRPGGGEREVVYSRIDQIFISHEHAHTY